MPQHDFIDVTKMIKTEAALLCACRCMRDGKHHIKEGSFAAGIAALYDAILFAMHYYITEPACRGIINLNRGDLWDHAVLYHKLVKAGIFDDPNAFNHLSLIVERSLWQESYLFDTDYVLTEVEKILSKLGVMPFNESILQSESIATC